MSFGQRAWEATETESDPMTTKEINFGQWWHGMTAGQQQAWAQKIHQGAGGGASALKAFDGVIRDELVVHVTFKDGTAVLVDRNGRVIPISGMKGVVDAKRAYYLTQPEIDYAARLARLQEFYGKDVKFMSAAEFEDRCKAALARITGNQQIANLPRGPHFPFALPQLQGDAGQLLNDTIIPALARSYKAQFSKPPFTNYREGELAGQVTVIPGTRQERLVEAMAKGPVCGVYFPALQGFGIIADREMITHLPENLILSGMEVPAVVTAYPEITGRDGKTPVLDMAALQWQSDGFSLGFRAYGDEAFFDRRGLYPCDRCSGGVSVLG
ncbi:hypothetical protein FJZ48_00200 [Candidatus Uhrbacteria bacterium]|nr:hypothetical protein [Candidatus Uhrbacteria bacterium]